jgi:hypothetical protein
MIIQSKQTKKKSCLNFFPFCFSLLFDLILSFSVFRFTQNFRLFFRYLILVLCASGFSWRTERENYKKKKYFDLITCCQETCFSFPILISFISSLHIVRYLWIYIDVIYVVFPIEEVFFFLFSFRCQSETENPSSTPSDKCKNVLSEKFCFLCIDARWQR